MSDIGAWIRARRQAMGATLSDLERLTGVSKRSIIRIEEGNLASSIGNVDAIIQALGGRIIIEEVGYAREQRGPSTEGGEE